MIEIRAANWRDVSFVASAMRDWDWREIWATRSRIDPAGLAYQLVTMSPWAWTAGEIRDDRYHPIAALGAAQQWPGVAHAWMFATPDFRKVARAVTDHALAVFKPALLDAGLRRLECHSMAGHGAAHRWLRRLGARIENADSGSGGAVPAFGADGQTFYRFVWLAEPQDAS